MKTKQKAGAVSNFYGGPCQVQRRLFQTGAIFLKRIVGLACNTPSYPGTAGAAYFCNKMRRDPLLPSQPSLVMKEGFRFDGCFHLSHIGQTITRYSE